MRPAAEAIVTRWPLRLSIIPGRNALTVQKSASVLTAKVRSIFSSGMSRRALPAHDAGVTNKDVDGLPDEARGLVDLVRASRRRRRPSPRGRLRPRSLRRLSRGPRVSMSQRTSAAPRRAPMSARRLPRPLAAPVIRRRLPSRSVIQQRILSPPGGRIFETLCGFPGMREYERPGIHGNARKGRGPGDRPGRWRGSSSRLTATEIGRPSRAWFSSIGGPSMGISSTAVSPSPTGTISFRRSSCGCTGRRGRTIRHGRFIPGSSPWSRTRCGRTFASRSAGSSFSPDAPTEDVRDPAPDGEAITSARETTDWLERAIQALPFSQREVLVLATLENLPMNDIASILGLPVGTVKTQLRRARLRLMEGYDRRTRATS